MDKITFSHFKKLLTCQPFFVWNKLDTTETFDEEEDENEKEFSFDFDFDDAIEAAETSALEVQAKSFSIIEREFFKRQVKSETDKLIIGKTLEERLTNTQMALNDPKVERLIRPLFCFKYKDFNVVATPSIWDKKHNKLSSVKLSSSTKKTDLLKFFFEAMVLEKSGLKVKDASMFVLATKEYKKGEVDFYETRNVRLSTSETKDAKAAKEVLNYGLMQLSKVAEDKESPFLIDIYKDKYIEMGRPKQNFNLFDIEYYLDKIIVARDCIKPTQPQESDNTLWGANKAFVELVKQFLPQYEGFSGNIVKKQSIIELAELDDIAKSSITLKQILDNEKPIVNDKQAVLKLIAPLNKKVVWYDFEAFSLPICPLDGLLPFQQTISQVSIIRTNEHIEQKDGSQNIVIDPLNISHEDFLKIINAIYWEDAYYVVYNKSYENTRLKEMIRIFKKYEHPLTEEMEMKVNKIIENTIDLADAFSCSANKLALIQIPYIKGKHSIKLLEKFVTAKYSHIPNQITPYKTLAIQNGMMAMELANNRALGIIGNEQWELEVPKLKEYCENDVRAMIMVYYLIKELVK